MKEKGTGEGTIYFNKQRRTWNAQYTDYDAKTGKLKRKTKSFQTQEEAKLYLDTQMYQRKNPIYIKHHGIPICEIMKANLELKLETNQISPVQYARVTHIIKQIEKTDLGHKKIDEITSEELQQYFNSLKYLSNSSINKIYQQFGQAFKVSINKGYLIRNPMADVIKPKSDKDDKVVRALTVEEQQAFTDYLTNTDLNECKYKNAFLIEMYMGLRCGETLALTTHDIDLKHKKVNIHRTLTLDVNGTTVMGNKTKTYAGNRIVPIPDFLYPYIIEQMQFANNQENNPEKLLFKPDKEKYTKRENVNTALKRILKKYFNITDISTHSLRHTYGTRCIESGMAPVVVQKLMGHKDVSVTLNTYTSVFDEFKQKEIDKVNQYYLQENLNLNNGKILLDNLSTDEEEKEIDER